MRPAGRCFQSSGSHALLQGHDKESILIVCYRHYSVSRTLDILYRFEYARSPPAIYVPLDTAIAFWYEH